MPHDVRAIANFILDEVAVDGICISNMQINKIVYFLHADFLAKFKIPLVTAKIEAWEHGPVFRELYFEFKRFSEHPIAGKATIISPVSGVREIAFCRLGEHEADFLRESIRRYAKMSAAALRAQSHVPGGPWDRVWNHDTVANPSMRITDEAILDWYGRSAKH